jgi:signal peptidase I
VKKLTIHTPDNLPQAAQPEAAVVNREALPVDVAQVLPQAPLVLGAPPVLVSPQTQPMSPLVLQTGRTPQAPVVLSAHPAPEPIVPTAPFVEPWLVPSSTGEAPQSVKAAPLSAPFVEPWLQRPAETSQSTAVLEKPEEQPAEKSPKKARKKKAADKRKSDTKAVLFTAARDVFIALALLFVMLQFFAPSVVREHSMESTLEPNEILYVTKQAYWFGLPGEGDIVIFKTDLTEENGAEKTLVKRIIGLPGDRISIQGGIVFRNGEPLDEPYTKSGTTPGAMVEVVVPEDSYFVLGDNREVSRDSRDPSVGFVHKAQLSGQVLVRVFPLNRFKVF